jgi:putative redox protein
MAPTIERITFPGSAGAPLAARLDRPAGTPVGCALFAHCFTCSKELFAAARIAEALSAEGFLVLRFDFTGLGASGGDFANTNFSSNLEDLRRAAAWLERHGHPPNLLVGHSLGGAAVVAVAADLPSVRAVATIGAPADPGHVTHLFADEVPTIAAQGEAQVQIGGRRFTIRRQLLEDLAAQRLAASAQGLRRALLVLHSPVDDIVGIDNAAELFQAARHPKSFVSLDGADHLLDRRADAVFAARIIATWASRYIDEQRSAL